MKKFSKSFYNNVGKRCFDLTIVIPCILLLLPILIVIALFVSFFLGKPVLFSQQRPGLHGKIFTIHKFRTMSNTYGANMEFLPDSERLSRFGQFLRSTSLDELPELYNVLKGDMSLVGPRPLLVEYLDKYNLEQARRHEVKPGITGWAQINGRNALSWEEKFRLDVWYVEHQSFLLDLKILFLTFSTVFRRRGISANGNATMPKFEGGS